MQRELKGRLQREMREQRESREETEFRRRRHKEEEEEGYLCYKILDLCPTDWFVGANVLNYDMC